MVTIRRFTTQGDALSAIVTLQSENIEAVILHENAIPSLTLASGGIEVQVAESDAARALEVLGRESGNVTQQVRTNGTGFLRGAIAGIGYTLLVGVAVFLTGGQFYVTGVGLFVLALLGGISGMIWWPPGSQSEHSEPEEKG